MTAARGKWLDSTTTDQEQSHTLILAVGQIPPSTQRKRLFPSCTRVTSGLWRPQCWRPQCGPERQTDAQTPDHNSTLTIAVEHNSEAVDINNAARVAGPEARGSMVQPETPTVTHANSLNRTTMILSQS